MIFQYFTNGREILTKSDHAVIGSCLKSKFDQIIPQEKSINKLLIYKWIQQWSFQPECFTLLNFQYCIQLHMGIKMTCWLLSKGIQNH